MSTNPSGAAIGRVAAAWRDGNPSPGKCAEIAAAIEQVAALLAADTGRAADGAGALERMADIAFVLHERDVEASLCDALDAAVRELGKAAAIGQARAERAQRAAESLRALARRVREMTALLQAERPIERSGAGAAETPRPAAARAIPGRAAEDHAMLPHGLGWRGSAKDVSAAPDASLFGSLPLPGDADEAAQSPRREATGDAAHALGLSASRVLVADQQTLPGPDEDPADLFEPMAGDPSRQRPELKGAAPAPPRRSQAPDQQARAIAAPAPPAASPAAAGAPLRAEPLPPASDPLEPVRALSEEEIIALFS